MSDLWFDDNTIDEMREFHVDAIIYNYGLDLQAQRNRIADLTQQVEALKAKKRDAIDELIKLQKRVEKKYGSGGISIECNRIAWELSKPPTEQEGK